MGAAKLAQLSLPDWGPADLVAALAPGPVALLRGLRWEGRSLTLVGWAPQRSNLGLREAGLAAGSVVDGAPPLLWAAVGQINWAGEARFWLPGAAALFDPEAGDLWVRGELPPVQPLRPKADAPPRVAHPLWSQEAYTAAVLQAQERMRRGELAKIILSVPMRLPCDLPPAEVYARLTADAPPGLGFILADEAGALVGLSPEPLVFLTGQRAEIHLLAGTRRAGAGLDGELLTHPKDRQEHLVALQQAEDDLGLVCEPRSVQVESLLKLERHPGLVHLASHIAGRLRAGLDGQDLVAACFPASTVAGVPRRESIALIDSLEPLPRDWYAGAVGAVLPGGDLQLWLTIRSLYLSGGEALLRTGAGLVAASDPAAEWAECMNKARRTLAALGGEVAAGD